MHCFPYNNKERHMSLGLAARVIFGFNFISQTYIFFKYRYSRKIVLKLLPKSSNQVKH